MHDSTKLVSPEMGVFLVGSSNRSEESKMNALQIERQLVFSRLSRKMRGDFSNLLEGKLMACLNRLGYDMDIKVRPASETIGQLRLAIA